MCVCGGCLDKYISVATWPFQTKIPISDPTNIQSTQFTIQPRISHWAHKIILPTK